MVHRHVDVATKLRERPYAPRRVEGVAAEATQRPADRAALRACERRGEIALDRGRVVTRGLGAREQHVEGADIGTGGVRTERRGLYERRPAACERIADDLAGAEVALQERLDELRHELPE